MINPFSPLQTIGIAGVLVVAAWGAGELHGHSRGVDQEIDRQRLVIAKQTEEARAKEQAQVVATAELQRTRDAELQVVNDRLSTALQRLRSRPDRRVPSPAAPACVGASGAELSGPDSGFLVGEAARADRLRADLETCRGWIETITVKK